MSRIFTLCVVVLAALAGVAGGNFALGTSSPASSKSPWNENYFPNLPVVTHDGKRLRFYDDLIRDKIVVIQFIYTSCSNICPLTTARLAQVKDMLGDRVGRDIFFYSITLDPVMDGPELLTKYAEAHQTGPGWLFLTGEPDDIALIRYKLGERSRSLSEHRNDVMLGNDRTGEWGRDSAFSDLKLLAAAILNMDPAWRNQVRATNVSPESYETTNLADSPGQGLFMKGCAACHTIGGGDRVGPDLAGVTNRRERDWLKRFIMVPDQMRAEKDPATVALDEKFPTAMMPNLGLSATDADDVITYLERQNAKVKSASPAGTSSEAMRLP